MPALSSHRVYSAEYSRLVAQAWDRLIADYPVDPSQVRRVVLDSWRRCQGLGVDPGRRMADIAGETSLERSALRRLRAGLKICLPSIIDCLAETRSVLIVSDASGIFLAVEGDPRLIAGLACNRAVPGAAWLEHQIGTNAIGTALALGRPVQIHGHEHFCEAGKPWSCTAAPIRDPGSGNILGVIDVTGPASVELGQAGALVMAVAERLQGFLAEQELRDQTRLLELFADRRLRSGTLVLFDRHGRVLKATDGAKLGGIELREGARVPGLDADSIERWKFNSLPDAISEGDLTALRHDGEYLGGIMRLPDLPSAPTPDPPPRLAGPFQPLLEASPSLAPLLAQAQRLATRRMPLVLQGETGTGKDLLAHAIHRAGPAPGGPFVAVNCAALPRDLIASELFGHAEGAFTGARRGGARGRFEQANGGTIFLDEIGEMPLELQPYLLRAVEEHRVTRLGETAARRINVRVIAATNRPLTREVEAGRFRADLFYRLNGALLELPPLRERLGDLPHLVAALLRQIVPDHALPPQAHVALVDRLRTHHWPGNVRELRNALERMVALSPEGELDPELAGIPGPSPQDRGTLRHAERTMILAAIAEAGGDARRAARTLGLSRATIYRRLRHYRYPDSGAAL